jgi:hypothetical protein
VSSFVAESGTTVTLSDGHAAIDRALCLQDERPAPASERPAHRLYRYVTAEPLTVPTASISPRAGRLARATLSIAAIDPKTGERR